MTASLRAVLFDLDGTLADTAPDLALALNLTRADAGLPGEASFYVLPETVAPAMHGASSRTIVVRCASSRVALSVSSAQQARQ